MVRYSGRRCSAPGTGAVLFAQSWHGLAPAEQQETVDRCPWRYRLPAARVVSVRSNTEELVCLKVAATGSARQQHCHAGNEMRLCQSVGKSVTAHGHRAVGKRRGTSPFAGRG
jgi:hypothetical protein